MTSSSNYKAEDASACPKNPQTPNTSPFICTGPTKDKTPLLFFLFKFRIVANAPFTSSTLGVSVGPVAECQQTRAGEGVRRECAGVGQECGC